MTPLATPSRARPRGHSAVMAGRVEPPESLEFFPTPPWATRALCERVLTDQDWNGHSVWEPTAGEGHMADVLIEYFAFVKASDVHDYGREHTVGSFTGSGPDVIQWDGRNAPDWIVTNPPFSLGVDFAVRAIEEARKGVALLLRSVWMESKERHDKLFAHVPPTHIVVFSERVPMTKGRWDPEASTATSYAWFVWRKPTEIYNRETKLVWIPPGQRKALEHPDDRRRFGPQEVSVS
jgi:hypothetical protein